MATIAKEPPGTRTRLANLIQNQKFQKNVFVLSALVPMIIFFGVFYIYPVIGGILGSLTNWRAFVPARDFVGLAQYQKLFADPIFLASVKNTFIYTATYLVINTILALSLALAVDASGILRSLFRTIYFLPVVTSVVATALIWNWLYQPRYGLINIILNAFGIPSQPFLRDPSQALISIVFYAVWKQVGYDMVLFMAGLSGISRSFYEAAKVDGANRWQVFRYITLPLLQPTVVFVTITGIIGSLQVFGPVYIMSSLSINDLPGGPLNSTYVISVYQYQVAFKQLELGYGSAMGIVLFIIVLVVTLFQSRFLRRRWEY